MAKEQMKRCVMLLVWFPLIKGTCMRGNYKAEQLSTFNKTIPTPETISIVCTSCNTKPSESSYNNLHLSRITHVFLLYIHKLLFQQR